MEKLLNPHGPIIITGPTNEVDGGVASCSFILQTLCRSAFQKKFNTAFETMSMAFKKSYSVVLSLFN